MRLYELSRAFIDLQESLGEDGEIAPDLAEQFDALAIAIDSKVEGCVAIIKNLQAQQEILKAEADRLAQRACGVALRVSWLKRYLMGQLEALGLAKVTGGLHGCRIQKNSQPSVDLGTVQVGELPDRFQRVKVEADLKAIADEWKETAQAPDGVSVKVGTHLRIL